MVIYSCISSDWYKIMQKYCNLFNGSSHNLVHFFFLVKIQTKVADLVYIERFIFEPKLWHMYQLPRIRPALQKLQFNHCTRSNRCGIEPVFWYVNGSSCTQGGFGLRMIHTYISRFRLRTFNIHTGLKYYCGLEIQSLRKNICFVIYTPRFTLTRICFSHTEGCLIHLCITYTEMYQRLV